MLQARDADAADEPLLSAFQCRNEFECADEVEEFVRAGLTWRDHEGMENRRLLIFSDEGTSGVVAIVAYELEPNGAFISFLAVSAAVHGQGIGAKVFRALMSYLGSQIPGGTVLWRIHVQNTPSQRMVRSALGFAIEPTYPPECLGYQEYMLSVQPAEPELPFELATS
jgi:RimJ/RimL family protein N-acetyltransferase